MNAPVPGHEGCTVRWTYDRSQVSATVMDGDAVAGDVVFGIETDHVFVRSVRNTGSRRRIMAAVLPVLLHWCVNTKLVTTTTPLKLSASGWLKHERPTADRIPLARYYARMWGLVGTCVDVHATARQETRDLDMATTVGALLDHVAMRES